MYKKMIQNNDTGKLLIAYYHLIMSKFMLYFKSDEKAINEYYKKRAGRFPNLVHPVSFSEKLQWLKLNKKNPLKEKCADKFLVREYVTSCGYKYLLNEIYNIHLDIHEMDISILPNNFVVKATHGSGWNLIVKNKSDVNWKIWEKIMAVWLKGNIFWGGREWVYKDLEPKLMVEKYLEDETGSLVDYKFFCFNGKPEFVQYEMDRFGDKRVRNFYDTNWNIMPFGKEFPHNPHIKIDKPSLFDEMLVIAKDLSRPFDFVRVDLYNANGRIYFGELTFFPAGGAPNFVPCEYDFIVGDMLTLRI